MGTLTLKEILFLWDEKAITAERMRELLTDVKEPQALPKVHERSMTTFRKQVRPENSYKPYSDGEDEQIMQGVNSNCPYKKIAKTLGRSVQAINHRVYDIRQQDRVVAEIRGGQTGMQL